VAVPLVILGFSFAIPAEINPSMVCHKNTFCMRLQLYTYQLFKNTRVELALLLAALIEVLVLDIQAFPMLFELGIAVFAKLLNTREA
jgi:hypothetical protein